jgi:hypothetical protein
MASKRQLAANRRNAKKSTGPKTPEGRAAVRLNGVKHGLQAETLILPGEQPSDFSDLLQSFEAEHQPATPIAHKQVRELAIAAWRLNRFDHSEAGLVDAGHFAYVSRLNARLEGLFYRALRALQVELHNQSQSRIRTPVLRPVQPPAQTGSI